jgi:SAM-dependent methyltransferase
MAPARFDRLVDCFACGGARMMPAGPFRYLEFQSGFVPDEWLGWLRRPAMLLRCPDCGSQGPALRPAADLLAEWYQRHGAPDLVSEGHLRAADRMRGLAPPTLVDVGCGRGAFLDLLAPTIAAFGLEPSVVSGRDGQERGRRILSPDPSGWSATLPDQVDVITLFDVIEHLPEPRAFLTQLAGRLLPGGRLVIFTGDAGSPYAQRWDRRWWYHGWAGHLSCFSARGLASLLRQIGLEVEWLDPLVYQREAMSLRSLRNLMRGAPLRHAHRLGGLGLVDQVLPPRASCPLGVDHMLVTARLRSR